MVSKLVIVSVGKLQNKVNNAVKSYGEIPGIYVSLNKTHGSIDNLLTKDKINTSKLFYIDCVTQEQKEDEVMYIHPTQLDTLKSAIDIFIKEIPGEKFLILDALSTLLIYNHENKVAQFVKEIIEIAAQKNVDVIAFSPETKGEELLNKIFNFFDEVDK
jgi:hypothetical protein